MSANVSAQVLLRSAPIFTHLMPEAHAANRVTPKAQRHGFHSFPVERRSYRPLFVFFSRGDRHVEL